MTSEINISVSEMNTFLNCRRAWDFGSHNRKSLRHKSTPKIYFMIGSAVHEAIDANAKGEDPFRALEVYIAKERDDKVAEYKLTVGSNPWKNELEEFEEAADLSRSLVNQYFTHYGIDNPLVSEGLRYVDTEVTFSIPILPGVNFVGTFDGILTDIETEKKIYLVENKTAARFPDLDKIQHSNQFIGYNWAFRELTGVTPSGTLYNGVMKRLIKMPKVLKSGKLSQDKNASVTLQSFMTGAIAGEHNEWEYLDYINFLEVGS